MMLNVQRKCELMQKVQHNTITSEEFSEFVLHTNETDDMQNMKIWKLEQQVKNLKNTLLILSFSVFMLGLASVMMIFNNVR